jgi:hypothetical protein
MSQVMVRYKVKHDAAAYNEELVRQVYQEMHQMEPTGIHYATFVLEDGVSFVHLASNDSEDGRNPLMEIAAFRAFQQGIDERCDEPPAPMGLREVGSYGFWAD